MSLLHRQVHPNFIQAGRVTSMAFRPSKKDQGRLSVDDGTKVTAEQSFNAFVTHGFPSAGVWSVSNQECQALNLPIVPDPIPDTQEHPNPAHMLIDFSGLSTSKTSSCAQILARHADERGCQYAKKQ
jgi:hypothetical protein